jgi:hypothetical protein
MLIAATFVTFSLIRATTPDVRRNATFEVFQCESLDSFAEIQDGAMKVL